MVADISGFTRLAESLEKMEQEASEILAFAINRYMELLVKFINRAGGDLVKYAGGKASCARTSNPYPRRRNRGDLAAPTISERCGDGVHVPAGASVGHGHPGKAE